MQAVALALEQLRRGGVAILLDSADAGYFALAAQTATPTTVGMMAAESGNRLVLALTHADFARLGQGNLATPLSELNASPSSLAETLRQAADPAGTIDPSAIPPLLVDTGGILAHQGAAEAAVDLMRLAGLRPLAALSAIEQPSGSPMTSAEIKALAKRLALPVLSMTTLVRHLQRAETTIDLVAVADLPTAHSDRTFRAHSFQSRLDGTEHIALVSPGQANGVPLVRIHSECLTGDAFGSLRCDCGPQLQESLRRLANSPGGILVYMRGHEGRGIGLGNKMRAYALQDQGMDTVEANSALGLPEDARDYSEAAHILRALGHAQIRLLSNNPEKVAALKRYGIKVTSVEPLVMPPNPFNAHYLATKVHKFGHTLPLRRNEQE